MSQIKDGTSDKKTNLLNFLELGNPDLAAPAPKKSHEEADIPTTQHHLQQHIADLQHQVNGTFSISESDLETEKKLCVVTSMTPLCIEYRTLSDNYYELHLSIEVWLRNSKSNYSYLASHFHFRKVQPIK